MNWRELRAGTKSDLAIVTRASGSSYTLQLRRGTTVTGVVRDAKTRTPVAGMIVGLREQGAVTDASGAFTFSPIFGFFWRFVVVASPPPAHTVRPACRPVRSALVSFVRLSGRLRAFTCRRAREAVGRDNL